MDDAEKKLIIEDARKAYGHNEGKTDIDFLCLRIIHMERMHSDTIRLVVNDAADIIKKCGYVYK